MNYVNFEWGDMVFLHLGNDMVIPSKEIIGLFDLETTTTTKETREFLKISEEEGFVTSVSDEDMPKSFVVTEKKGQSAIYLSPISVTTLKKRINKNKL